MLKRNQVYEAIRKGKFFELQYSGMFDANKKRVCLTNCINLIKATKGKNLLVSSGLSSHIYHRSPVDICSLLLTLGMKRERAIKCLNV
jgi:ribonuclease P/MRP protein subunit RPP1